MKGPKKNKTNDALHKPVKKPATTKMTKSQRDAILRGWRQGAPAPQVTTPAPKPVPVVTTVTKQSPVIRSRLTPYQRASVAAAQSWRCNCCRVLFKALWHVDHVVPLADGGEDDPCNMQALCANCHASKTSEENMLRKQSK